MTENAQKWTQSPAMVEYSCNHSTAESEARKLCVPDHPGLHKKKILFQSNKTQKDILMNGIKDKMNNIKIIYFYANTLYKTRY